MSFDEAAEEDFMNVALELVKKAGVLVRDAFSQPRNIAVKTKTSDLDLLTETDTKVEELLINGITAKFPNHKFIGEESVAEGAKLVFSDHPTWIIDPIDGTTNFVHRLPFVAICVALAVKKQLRGGIVFNPILNDLYFARAGKGAFKNGFPIHTSGTKGTGKVGLELNKSIFLGTFGGNNIAYVGLEKTLAVHRNNNEFAIASGVRGHRSFGSAALNMTYIAEGAADIHLEYGLHCWDFAASAIILTEAGGVVLDPTGKKVDLMGRRVLCASTMELAQIMAPKLMHIEFEKECQ